MKKLKLITTCASLVLMVAFMAFGVYALQSATMTVSGTVSYQCTNVAVKVTYGLVGGTTYGPFISQETDPISWKDENGNAVTFTNGAFDGKLLPDVAFTEANLTCTYFITVESLHGMAIGLNFGYKWANTVGNAISASAKVYNGDVNSTQESTVEFNPSTGIATAYELGAKATQTLKVTLTLDSTKLDNKASGNFQMAMASAVQLTDVPAISF